MNLLEKLDELSAEVKAALPGCDADAVCQDLMAAREKLEHLTRNAAAVEPAAVAVEPAAVIPAVEVTPEPPVEAAPELSPLSPDSSESSLADADDSSLADATG